MPCTSKRRRRWPVSSALQLADERGGHSRPPADPPQQRTGRCGTTPVMSTVHPPELPIDPAAVIWSVPAAQLPEALTGRPLLVQLHGYGSHELARAHV